jgi:hypothetical protein
MQIINKGSLKILIPENGYELINKNTNIHSDKVYLGKTDSMDNYIEVMKDDFIDSIETLKEQNDIDIKFIIETIDGLIALLEPILMAIPLTIGESNINPLDRIINFYVEIINRGLKNEDDVPSMLKEFVHNSLNKKNL